MYGDLANKLVLDAKRSAPLADVPLYQNDLVRDVIRETLDLNRDVDYLAEQLLQLGADDSEEQAKINQCQLFVTHLCMRRNKRCLLAYEKARADKIDEFVWLNIDPTDSDAQGAPAAAAAAGSGATGSSAFSGVTSRLSMANLSHAEQEYYKQYQRLVMHYKSGFPDLDLLGDLEPPTNIFIDVRVLKDGGEVQTEYGVFNLIKDSQFYVRKSDVERLIQQGYLEEI